MNEWMNRWKIGKKEANFDRLQIQYWASKAKSAVQFSWVARWEQIDAQIAHKHHTMTPDDEQQSKSGYVFSPSRKLTDWLTVASASAAVVATPNSLIDLKHFWQSNCDDSERAKKRHLLRPLRRQRRERPNTMQAHKDDDDAQQPSPELNAEHTTWTGNSFKIYSFYRLVQRSKRPQIHLEGLVEPAWIDSIIAVVVVVVVASLQR